MFINKKDLLVCQAGPCYFMFTDKIRITYPLMTIELNTENKFTVPPPKIMSM